MKEINELIGAKKFTEAFEILKNFDGTEANHYEYVYYQVVVLKGLNRFDEALDILVEELKMPYIPMVYEDGFNQLYDELVQLKGAQINKTAKKLTSETLESALFKGDNFENLVQVLYQLKDHNVRTFIDIIKRFLIEKDRDPVIKTLLIEILNDQEYDKEIELNKDGEISVLVPSETTLVIDYEEIGTVQALIYDELFKEPSLIASANQLLDYFLYHTFPKRLDEKGCLELFCSIIIEIKKMYGADTTKDLFDKYAVNLTNVENNREILRKFYWQE